MNFTRLSKVFLLALPMLLFSNAMATGLQEEAIEGEPDTFFLGQELNGAIRNKICDTCPEVKLVITPKAEAYVDRQPTDLKAMADSSKKPYLIFYDVKNNQVTRMYWQSK
jgi:hypothetical protein